VVVPKKGLESEWQIPLCGTGGYLNVFDRWPIKTEPLISQTFPLKEACNNLTRFEEAGRANIKMLIEMDA
jgi:hypothetical protein